jgi:hypothetical protein
VIAPDTSVTIAAAAPGHHVHAAAIDALGRDRAALIAHVGLLTADRRAAPIYAHLGADVDFVGG